MHRQNRCFESRAFLLTSGAEHHVPVCIQKVRLGMASVFVARFGQNQGFLDSLESGPFACLPHYSVERQAELPVARGGPAPVPGADLSHNVLKRRDSWKCFVSNARGEAAVTTKHRKA